MQKTAGSILLVRHAETPANRQGLWHGSTDTPLTAEGRRQAQRLARHLAATARPAAVYASPLARARDTARALASACAVPLLLDPRLVEFSVGQWEGASFVEIARTLDPERRLLRDPHFSPPGGDSQLAVRDRMVAALEEIRARHAGEAIALVSHGVAIAVLLAHLCHGDTTRWREFHHHNTGYTRLCAVTLEPLELNCTDHLG